MIASQYAGFFERLGHRVVATRSAHWYDARARLYLSLPHSVTISPDRAELEQLFSGFRAWGARFPAPVTAPGRESYALVADDPNYALERLSGNARSKVRRGLKQCDVRRVEPAFIRAHGERANNDTLTRLTVKDPYPWARYWDAAAATPDIEVWAALDGADPVAYLVIAVVDGVAELLVARSRDDALRHYPNNALVFTAVQDLIKRPSVHEVFFGLESLEAESGVDRFKESVGFHRMPLRQRVVFPPLVNAVLSSSVVSRVLQRLARRQPAAEAWRKLEGLLIFHGSLPDTRVAHKETAWTS